jgi:hypothetical protein
MGLPLGRDLKNLKNSENHDAINLNLVKIYPVVSEMLFDAYC